MALILFGGGISAVSGSIGGTVFSRNRYGAIARNRSIPVNPNSSRQQAIKNIMGSVVASWFNDLSLAQRQAWSVYAAAIPRTNKLGQTITLTGFNHYVRTNISRVSNGFTRILDGPVNLTLPPTDGIFDVAWSEGSQEVSVTFDTNADWVTQDSAFMSIHQGAPQNSAIQFFGNHFRRIGNILGDSGSPPTSPQTIAVDFPIAQTQKVWGFGRVQEVDGRLSDKFRADSVVTA